MTHHHHQHHAQDAAGRTVVRLHRNPEWIANGARAYARSIRRYRILPTKQTPLFFNRDSFLVYRRADGQTYTPTLDQATQPDMTGQAEVPANDIQNDLEYVCPVKIGTPGVTLQLDFDTGSSDLWVWSSEFRTTKANTANHTVYDPSKSSTSKEAPGLTWKITYGDGSSASGDVFDDVIHLGSLAVPNQAVELASKLSDSFLESGSDGLLGLAFPEINTVSTPQKTPVENMIEKGLIEKPLFTVKLDKQDSKGFYTFGFIDDSVTTNPMNYTAINKSNGFWEFNSATLKIGDKVVNRARGNTAIADTGTTLILLDDNAVEEIYSSIPGANLDSTQGGYILPTNSTDLPELSFAVGNNIYSIPGDDLKFTDAGNGMSFGAIQSRGQNPQDILGDVFLKRVYVVFEQGSTPRIGIAQRPY